jgi:hypothetical protein
MAERVSAAIELPDVSLRPISRPFAESAKKALASGHITSLHEFSPQMMGVGMGGWSWRRRRRNWDR